MKTFFATTTAALALMASAAHADIITISYEVEFPSTPWNPEGSTVNGEFTYDTDATPIWSGDCSSGMITQYPMINPPYDGGAKVPARILVWDCRPTFGQIDFSSGSGLTLFFWREFEDIDQPTRLPASESDMSHLTNSDAWDSIIGSGRITKFEFLSGEEEEVLSCEGFDAPADDPFSVKGKGGVVPFKARVLDENGLELGPNDKIDPPVFSMALEVNGGTIPVDDEFIAGPGRANVGNLFVWNEAEQLWQYNLSVKGLAAGFYHVNLVEQPDMGYRIEPCFVEFLRQ